VSSAGAASAAGSPQTFTITDGDDIAVSIARHMNQAATVDEGQSAQFTVTLSGASGGSAANITVPYSVTISGAGYTPTDSGGGSLQITAGQTTGAITIQMPISAALGASDPDQTVTVTLGSPTVGTGGGNVARSATPAEQSAQVTVDFQDAKHMFTFSSPAASIAEGGSATYTVARSGPDTWQRRNAQRYLGLCRRHTRPGRRGFGGATCRPAACLQFTDDDDASKTSPLPPKTIR